MGGLRCKMIKDIDKTQVQAWHDVFLSIGSNVGDRVSNLQGVIDKLSKHDDLKMCEISKVYETKPWGLIDQDDFLNCAVKIQTRLSPYELLSVLKDIERNLGREKNVKWGPRTADVDILFFGDIELDDDILTIPHKYMWERAFVLVPLADIAPCIDINDEKLSEYVKKMIDKDNIELLPIMLR